MKYKDMYGNYISEGDHLIGSYGIPPRKIDGIVFRESERLLFRAEGHHPEVSRLKTALDCLDLYINIDKVGGGQ